MRELISEICLHIAAFLSFLIPFYFLFVVWVQQKAMVRDIVNVVNDAKNDLGIQGNLNIPASFDFNSYFTINNDDIFPNNKKVILGVSIVAPILFLLLIGVAYYIAPHCFVHNLVNAICMYPFIAFAEFFILGAFVYNYVEVDLQSLFQVMSVYPHCSFLGMLKYNAPTPIYNIVTTVINLFNRTSPPNTSNPGIPMH